MSLNSLMSVDWSLLPVPLDDGAAKHLTGARLPDVVLTANNGAHVATAALSGRTVIYIYPLTGRPDTDMPPGWDDIPGARGCTPQSCAFRDSMTELRAASVKHIFGLSVQDTAYQHEAAARLRLPFPLLSDRSFEFSRALNLPTFTVGKTRYLKRMTLVADDARITKVFYPVFPPDENPHEILAWSIEAGR